MLRHTLIALATCALSSAAIAQPSATYIVTVDDPLLAPGETTVVRVFVHSNPGGPTAVYVAPNGISYNMLGPGSGYFDLVAAGGATGSWHSMGSVAPYWFGTGVASGSTIEDVVWGVPFFFCCSCVYWSVATPAPAWTGTFRAGHAAGELTLTAEPDGPVIDVRGDSATACWGTFDFEAHPSAPAIITIDGCYPDCNQSGDLTIADFGCFQTRFANGDLYADCNESGTLTIADFSCFQGQFAAGCP